MLKTAAELVINKSNRIYKNCSVRPNPYWTALSNQILDSSVQLYIGQLCPISYWTDQLGRNGTKRDKTGHFRQMTEEQKQEGELSDIWDCSRASSQK